MYAMSSLLFGPVSFKYSLKMENRQPQRRGIRKGRRKNRVLTA